jgi:EAL domain-containing protein (putative c-di-GMP-specific phosphodiesterase class I)
MTDQKPAEDKESKGSVLIVDDEPGILRAFRRTLERAGYTVTTADEAESGLEMVREFNFDLVLSDIAMPGMDGISMLREIRRHNLDVPVVLVTGAPSVGSAVDAIELGALKYLLKPVDGEELRNTVSYAVRMNQLAKAKRDALDYLGEKDKQASDRAGLEASFNSALEKLWIAWQPIFHWNDKKVFGYEALVRSDEKALPHPGALFDAAERLDRLDDIGRAIRAAVAAGAGAIAPEIKLFVNLHPQDLVDETLYEATGPLTPLAKRIVLEITERASLDRIPDLVPRLDRLRDLGFSLAVDDLGAGYAGLTAFAQIQPQVAKIDMSLVRDVDKDKTKQRLIQAMTDACSEMEILVVIEGIETQEERDAPVVIGGFLFQGFYFGKPSREPQDVDM